jgi:putative endopeptidase
MKTRAAFLFVALSVAVVFAEPTGKPQYGAWGFDTDGADLKTKPGDDFFRYANGTWLDRTQIPADKPGYSLRLAMTDLTEQRLHDLMEETAKKAEPKPAT